MTKELPPALTSFASGSTAQSAAPALSERYLQLVEREGWGNGHSMSGLGICQDMVQPEVGDPLEMSEVTGNEFKVVIDGSSRDLHVGVGKDVASLLSFCADHPEDTSCREIERKEGDGGKDTFLYVD